VAAELEVASPQSKGARAAERAARRAGEAARRARAIVDARNDAYTFHTDAGFSFGEGWYVAAAAVLAGIAIQVEPEKAGTAQAERFLADAGLNRHLVPYRSRPRAVKQTTEIVARAFRTDPRAMEKLRASFLGESQVPESIAAWVASTLSGAPGRPMVLVWVRDGAHHPGRNTTFAELTDLTERAHEAGLAPLWIGDAVRDGEVPPIVVDMTLFWKLPLFRGPDSRRAQLQLFEHLRRDFGLVGQVGVTTAGMDGPALMGLPTMYITDAANVRMGTWVGAVPGYREIVRGAGYLDRVGGVLTEWARGYEARGAGASIVSGSSR
jgi:hypothetical protein